MTKAIRLRRVLIATLILTATLTVFPVATGASAAPMIGSRTRSTLTTGSATICPIDWRKGKSYVEQLVRCAAKHYGVNTDKALYVANRESNFSPTAYNSWSCAKGIFQHLCRYWPTRATTYGFTNWSAFNARANIMVTMRMVRRYGWAPWGG